METVTGNLQDVAKLIQLAIAPIFLLSAVATTLMVLINRLGRIVDRGRSVESQTSPEQAPPRGELLVLERRARLIYRAIFLGVTAAILVCLLMTVAFLSQVLQFHAAQAVAFFFLGALFAYTGALLCLMREVFLAIGHFHLGIKPGST